MLVVDRVKKNIGELVSFKEHAQVMALRVVGIKIVGDQFERWFIGWVAIRADFFA